MQSNYINEASVTAGVTAVEGEMRKDDKHQLSVEQCGGRFVPLVAETLGLWAPYAMTMLKSIATRATIKKGLSETTAANRRIL